MMQISAHFINSLFSQFLVLLFHEKPPNPQIVKELSEDIPAFKGSFLSLQQENNRQVWDMEEMSLVNRCLLSRKFIPEGLLWQCYLV